MQIFGRGVIHFFCGASVLVALLWPLDVAAQKKETAPPAAPSLTLKQVQDMVSSELNSVDILVESKSRGLAFIVSASVISNLQERGADDLLLNWLGLYSVELRPQYVACVTQQQQKRFGRVVELCTELLNRSPRLLHIYLIRGGAYRAQNQLDNAVQDFRQALKFHHNSSRARVLLAESLIAQKETDAAIPELNWVLEHHSAAGIQDWPTAHRLLAEAFLQRREYRLASNHLHTALWQLPMPHPESVALLPDLEDHMSVLAKLLALCPDQDIASPADAIEIAHLLKLMATDKNQQQQALVRLAEAQAASGQFDDAVATQKAAEINATGDSAAALRERLAVYEQKQVPFLPAGEKTAETQPQTITPVAVVPTFREQMKLVGKDAADTQIKPFWIAKFEVTQEQWASVMGLPRSFTPQLPVDRISWDQCQLFFKKLNEKSKAQGRQFRLPTVAEWKFAAQAGGKGTFSFGDDVSTLADFAWFLDHGNRTVHPVGRLRENPLGLFDMYGNVAEWCQDETSIEESGKPKTATIQFRVVMGGSCLSSADQCSAAVTGIGRQDLVRRGLGFRVACDQSDAADASTVTTPPNGSKTPDDAKTPIRKHEAGLTRAMNDARSTLEVEVFHRAWLQDKLFTLVYLQACVRNEMDDSETAVNNLRALVREMPDDNSPLMHLTRCHLAWIQSTRDAATPEQIAEARRMVETSLSRSEFKYWISYLAQSSVLVAEGNQEDAVRRATQASDLAPVQFKEICASQLKSIQNRKAAMSRLFPVSPAIAPAAALGQ